MIGGGPIGCELAQSFARLGAQVSLIEAAPRIMMREDEEVSAVARASLEADGVQVLTGHQALRCEKSAGMAGDAVKSIVVQHQGREIRLEFDALLCAVGRVARLTGYGLEELGIAAGHTIEVQPLWTSPSVNPQDSLQEKQFFAVLEACVQDLPAQQGRVFMMREWLELSTDEICQELGVSTSNLWVLLHRARAKLQACLQQRWFATSPTVTV